MTDFKKFLREGVKKEVITDPMQDLTEEEKLNELLRSSHIDLSKEYVEPPMYVGICNEWGEELRRVCTPANISAITGKAKAKKSFVQSMIVAAAVSGGKIQRRIVGNLPENKRQVLVFDTEQGVYDVYRVNNRIVNLAGTNEHLGVFSLRGLNAKQIIDLINHALTIFKKTGIIFIDQVADLAKSINSEEEAVEIVRWLEKLTAEKNLHICCVIHQNKGDNYASGWLGSQIMKKAETVVSVEVEPQNKDISHVKPSLTRSREFEEFSIMINNDGLPQILDKHELDQYNTSMGI